MAAREVKDLQWINLKKERDLLLFKTLERVIMENLKVRQLVDMFEQKSLSKVIHKFQENESEAKIISIRRETISSKLNDILDTVGKDRDATPEESEQIENYTQELEALDTKFNQTIPKFHSCIDKEIINEALNQNLPFEGDDSNES